MGFSFFFINNVIKKHWTRNLDLQAELELPQDTTLTTKIMSLFSLSGFFRAL